MTIEIRGRVVSGSDGRRLFGALVELSHASVQVSAKTLRAVTNRSGSWRFRISEKQLGAVEGLASMFLRVLDEKGDVLGKLGPLELAPRKARDVEIEVPRGDLKCAALPPQPGQSVLISDDVFTSIRNAVHETSEPDLADAHLTTADNVFCSLPPIVRAPELIDIGEGVLRGHSQDFAAFQALLDSFETWNHRSYQYERKSLSPTKAAEILSDSSLERFAKQFQAAKKIDAHSVISSGPAITILAAAMRVANNDPVAVNRNIGIVLEQFCGIAPLANLYHAGRVAVTGRGGEHLFLGQLRMFGDMCGPGIATPSAGAWLPVLPGRPRPFPCPGGPPWPPSPPRPGFPLPGGGAFRGGECPTIDVVRGLRDALARRQSYSITDISPQHACSGEIITITGTGFTFEGQTGIVNFPGLERGSHVPSDTPLSWTDTEVRVAVPDGACDGDLDLGIPGASDQVVVCDHTVELFVASGGSVPFTGGDTRIRSFTASARSDACLAPGQTVWLSWDVCNSAGIRLDVWDDAGSLIDRREFGGDVIGTRFEAPADLSESKSLTLTLTVTGRCGTDSATTNLSVRKGAAPIDRFQTPRSFENFLGNIRRIDLSLVQPSTLSELVNAVQAAEAGGNRVGVMGGACSYNDFIVPRATTNHLINTDNLNRTHLDNRIGLRMPPRPIRYVIGRPVGPIPGALRPDLDESNSIISREALATYGEFITVSPLRDRLVHVEAGIRFDRLVCLLERFGLTMPTLGGGKRHSVAGAISTSTHGSTTRLPPIADFLRAIHLVGTGGQQWWLEPASNRITDPDLMKDLKQEGKLDPCLRIRYDDDLFYSALVSFGTAGVFYSVVIETIDEHNFIARTTEPTWSEAKTTLRNSVVSPATPADWFFEVTMAPTGRTRLSTLNLTNEPEVLADSASTGELINDVVEALVDVPRRLARAIPIYVARMILRALNPFNAGRIFREMRETIEMTRELARLAGDFVRFVGTGASPSAIASALPNILNLLWRVGSEIGVGRNLIDEFHNLMVIGERPLGTFFRKDHRGLTFSSGQCPGSLNDDTLAPEDFSEMDPFRRLFRSSEYTVPAQDAVDFADAILDAANRAREGPDALVLQINLRFTQATRAYLGMQQFERSFHAELFTIKGLNGNRAFDRLLEPVLDRFQAVPHFGQLHSSTTDYNNRFSALTSSGRSKLDTWRRSIDTLASDNEESPNTFRHAFALQRRLLSDL